MKAVSKETLKRVNEEFPTLSWADEELEELVAPRYGLITGFQELLQEIEKLRTLDLGETGPAGAVHRVKEPR